MKRKLQLFSLALLVTVFSGIVYQKWFNQDYYYTVMCQSGATGGVTFVAISERVRQTDTRIEMNIGSYYPGVLEFCKVERINGPMPPLRFLDFNQPPQPEPSERDRSL